MKKEGGRRRDEGGRMEKEGWRRKDGEGRIEEKRLEEK